MLEKYNPAAFYNDRDCWTKIQDMHNHSFVVFWEKYNYGGEQSEPYRKLSDVEFIGTFTRRNPNSGDIMQVHPSIDINLDNLPSEFKISHEIVKYAFENSGIDEQFSITPDLNMKIIFFSRNEGAILKVPATMLFLLAQEICPINELEESDLERIALAWDNALNIYEACRCYEYYLQSSIFVSEFQPYLTIRKSDIFKIIELIKETEHNRILSDYVEEVWELLIDAENQFKWNPIHIRDSSTQFIGTLWETTNRISRVNQIGKKYHLNQRYLLLRNDQMPQTNSLSIEPMIPNSLHVMQEDHLKKNLFHYPEEETPFIDNVPVSNFKQFYKRFYRNNLMLIETDTQYILFRETEVRSPRMVLVQIVNHDSVLKSHNTGGMLPLHALLNCLKEPLRFFTYTHNESIIEEGAFVIRDILMEWITDSGVKIDNLLNLLSWVRNHNRIRIDVGFSEIIRNAVIFQQYAKTKQYLTNIYRMFQFIPDTGKFNELEVNVIKAEEIHTEQVKKIKEKEQFKAEEAELGKNCFPDDETFYKWYSKDDWIYHHKDDWYNPREDDEEVDG